MTIFPSPSRNILAGAAELLLEEGRNATALLPFQYMFVICFT